MRWMAVAVTVGLSGLVGGCGSDDDDGASRAPADEGEAPGAPEAGVDDGDADAGADAGADGAGEATAGNRYFSGVCPAGEDIAARLGVEVTFQPELILDLEPAPEVECRYEWDDHNDDKGRFEASRQRGPEADFVFDGWADMDVDGETVVGVEPVDLGEEGVVVSYGSWAVSGTDIYHHGADVVARVGDGLCHTQVEASSREPERSSTLDDTAQFITAALCS